MINELIEKEIEKFRKEGDKVSFDWSNAGGDWDLEALFEESLQTIAKEVAMRFIKQEQGKEYFDLIGDGEAEEVCFDMSIGYNRCVNETNSLADQIINEVSK